MGEVEKHPPYNNDTEDDRHDQYIPRLLVTCALFSVNRAP